MPHGIGYGPQSQMGQSQMDPSQDAPQPQGQRGTHGVLGQSPGSITQGIGSDMQATLRPRPLNDEQREEDQRKTQLLKSHITPGLPKNEFKRILDENPDLAQFLLNAIVRFPSFPVGGS